MFRKEKVLILYGIIITGFLLFIAGSYLITQATTNISATDAEHMAWEEKIGWWDFYATDNVTVSNTKVEGYASSSFGFISLDCATSPIGNICGSYNYGVCNGPGSHGADGTCTNGNASGELSGWAWNDEIGWISLNCDETSHGGLNYCGSGTTEYKVEVDPLTGIFTGWAWNDVVGWISFNNGNHPGNGSSTYAVVTSWRATSTVGYLESSIFDTERIAGGLLNAIVWQGTDPLEESCVSFQIAASNSAGGPWNYEGPSGDNSLWYGLSCESFPNGGAGCAADNTPICVDKSRFVNYRYLRYKVHLRSTRDQTSPEITDIILNWSP